MIKWTDDTAEKFFSRAELRRLREEVTDGAAGDLDLGRRLRPGVRDEPDPTDLNISE